VTIVHAGKPEPFGVYWDGDGANVAVWSVHASAVDFCMFYGPDFHRESARIRLPSKTDDVWHGYVSGVGPGLRYGFRVHGPYDPENGLLFNAQKLLVDPYAKALQGQLTWHECLASHAPQHLRDSARAKTDEPLQANDTCALVPKGVIVDPSFNWAGDAKPNVGWRDTLIYECHVKGLTALHPDVPVDQRGRYLGVASKPIINHLKKLGVTAVELLPVAHAVDERALVKRGLINYWGYNPLAWFAPQSRYATGEGGQQVREFKEMVRRLHSAGIEVILDVVFNHTAEGDHTGPTLCLKGLGNAEYYRLRRDDKSRYENLSGCGNTLNFGHPITRRMAMDCLRYWAQEMHVDGFRFDLATVLTRGPDGKPEFDGFVKQITEDPILHDVKLVSEPWDAGRDGYALGHFPHGWSEWNDQYSRTLRRFWRGDGATLGQLAYRLSGSSDVFGPSGRKSCASINYVTSHDGFNLHDLTTYEKKRNDANREGNHDGSGDNDSCNWGWEGETDAARIGNMRQRMQRNFLAGLFLSRGVPMILAGDDVGHTQRGNNNAYCQDNEVSWIDWRLDSARRQLRLFARSISALRQRFNIVSSCEFYRGEVICRCGLKDITWVQPDGTEMTPDAWQDPLRLTLGMVLHGHDDDERNGPDDSATLLVVFHASADRVSFSLPAPAFSGRWSRLVDTALSVAARRASSGRVTSVHGHARDKIIIKPRSVVVYEYAKA